MILRGDLVENFPDEIAQALAEFTQDEINEFKALAYHELVENEAA
mgnify:CR=1 FL=1